MTAKEAAKTRGLGGKRVCQINISTTSEYEQKLTKLSITTGGMSKSHIADMILRIGLDSAPVVDWIQEEYGARYKEHHYRAIDVKNNGVRETIYTSK